MEPISSCSPGSWTARRPPSGAGCTAPAPPARSSSRPSATPPASSRPWRPGRTSRGRVRALARALIESSVEVTGTSTPTRRRARGPGAPPHARARRARRGDLPITKDQSEELLLDLRHLWLRSRQMTARSSCAAPFIQASSFYLARLLREPGPDVHGRPVEGGVDAVRGAVLRPQGVPHAELELTWRRSSSRSTACSPWPILQGREVPHAPPPHGVTGTSR